MATVSEPEIEEPPEENNSSSSNNAVPPAAAAALASSSSPPAVPWPAGVAERYERREWLGKGMFGDVYKAWDRVQKRDVAVKRLSTRTDERFVAAPLPYFEREVVSLRACRGHPSVVEILDTADCSRGGDDGDGDRFVVTEYAGPMNLRTYMRRRRGNGEPFDEDEVRDAMQQLLAGAAHAHAAGVLHRDMVPENVVVDFDAATGRMVYKICGFGLSESMADDKDGFGKLACACPYRAPELFLGCKDYNDRVDTWSLGCIMAELVTGNGGVPFFSAPDGEVCCNMLRVVGIKGILMWKVASLWKTGRRGRGNLKKIVMWKAASLWKTGRGERGNRLDKMSGRRERGSLKKMFPLEVLSPAGFKVLKGLLHSNADRRLSAADALRKPWFHTSNDDETTST